MNVNEESWNQKESDWIIKEETLYLGEERLHPDEENWILQEESFHDGEERKLIGELTQTQKLSEQKKNLNCPTQSDTKAVREPPSRRFNIRQEVGIKAPRNARPQHPAKPVRGIRATKSGRGFQKGRGWRLKPGPF